MGTNHNGCYSCYLLYHLTGFRHDRPLPRRQPAQSGHDGHLHSAVYVGIRPLLRKSHGIGSCHRQRSRAHSTRRGAPSSGSTPQWPRPQPVGWPRPLCQLKSTPNWLGPGTHTQHTQTFCAPTSTIFYIVTFNILMIEMLLSQLAFYKRETETQLNSIYFKG